MQTTLTILTTSIDDLTRHGVAWSRMQAIDDLAQLVLNTLSTTLPFVDFHPSMLVSLERYQTNPEAWQCLQDAVTAYFTHAKACAPYTDILGPLYDQELGKQHGQFMTPSALAENAGRFLGNALMPGSQVTDPTCGTGAMLLARLREQHDLHVTGNDINQGVLKVACCDLLVGAFFHGRAPRSMTITLGDVIAEYHSGTVIMSFNGCTKPS